MEGELFVDSSQLSPIKYIQYKVIWRRQRPDDDNIGHPPVGNTFYSLAHIDGDL